METLEERLQNSFEKFGVSEPNRDSITNYLEIIRKKDQPTYEHSVRVGLLASEIAEYLHLDAKALLFAGTLHDLGKVLIPPEVLKKTEGFDEKDMETMKKHPEFTYAILRGVHEFSAEVAVRHHRFQENGYPKKLPKPAIKFSSGTETMINYMGRILSLADFYDAAAMRVNNKFGAKRKLPPEEVHSILLTRNPDQRKLIGELYEKGIFGNNSYEKFE